MLINYLNFRHYTSQFNPLAGLVHLKLGKIYPHLNEFQEALSHIREAGDILKVTHGDQSRIMRCVRELTQQTQALHEASQRMAYVPADDEDEEEEAAAPAEAAPAATA